MMSTYFRLYKNVHVQASPHFWYKNILINFFCNIITFYKLVWYHKLILSIMLAERLDILSLYWQLNRYMTIHILHNTQKSISLLSCYSGSLSYADLSYTILSSVEFWKDSKKFEQCDFYYKVLKLHDFEIAQLKENRVTQNQWLLLEIHEFWAARTFPKTKNRVAQGTTVDQGIY